jgi:hypothetical protein
MAVLSRELEENLDLVQANREEAYEYVLAYARRRFGRYKELIILEDVVDGVFKDLENGVRHLTPSRTPLRSLYGMVDSKMSHWLDKKRQHDSLEAVEEITVSSSQVEEIDLRLLCHALGEICKDEPLILKMLSLWADDPNLKPSDFAEILNIDVMKVYKAKERLKKLTVEIREEWLFKC